MKWLLLAYSILTSEPPPVVPMKFTPVVISKESDDEDVALYRTLYNEDSTDTLFDEGNVHLLIYKKIKKLFLKTRMIQPIRCYHVC